MGNWLTDLRYTFRSLSKSPGYTAVALSTIALGIGANSAIFSVVNSVLLKPLEYQAPNQLVMLHTQFPTMGFDKFWVSAPEYREFREWNQSFTEVAIYNVGLSSLQTNDQPVRVSSGRATAEFFDVLGVGARHGRVFIAEEDLPGSDDVVVLSHELWTRAFGADSAIVGRRIQVDGELRTVVGVMPPRFDIDDNRVELWLPLALDPNDYPRRGSHNYYMIARLAPGVGVDQARAELGSLLAGWRERSGEQHSPNPEGHPMIITALHDEVVGDVRPRLVMLLAVVGLVLLVACANVANLLLAKAESRQKEIAVRSAMGAGRLVLLRQFLVESLSLALMGGVLGLLIAHFGIRILFAISPGSVPRAAEIGIDGSVLLFSFAVSIITGILFGLAPMMHVTSKSLGLSLKDGGRRTTATSGRQLLRRILVVSEIAAAVMAVVVCGLLLRSFWNMQQVEPGFNPRGLSTFELYLPQTNYPEPSDQIGFFSELSADLAAIPGVESASAMSGLPPRRRLNANDMAFEGIEPTPDGPPQNVDYWQIVTEGYFETMQIKIVAGRAFEAVDAASPSVVINETMAEVFWPDQNPLGRRVRPSGSDIPWFTIVGIAKDVKQAGLEEETGTESYFYYPVLAAAGFAPRSMHIVMRSSLPPESIAASAREVVWSRDTALPLANLSTMDVVLADSLAGPRFMTLLLVVFAVLALLLAAVGTYGVMSYTVAERTNEIGIRMALGAGASRIVKMVLTQGLILASIGLVFGLVMAFALSRFVSSFLFGVSATDLSTFVTVPAILLAVALVACLVPAYRAMRVEPVTALRYE